MRSAGVGCGWLCGAEFELGVGGEEFDFGGFPVGARLPPDGEGDFDDVVDVEVGQFDAGGSGEGHDHGVHADDLALGVFEVVDGFVLDFECDVFVGVGARGDDAPGCVEGGGLCALGLGLPGAWRCGLVFGWSAGVCGEGRGEERRRGGQACSTRM